MTEMEYCDFILKKCKKQWYDWDNLSECQKDSYFDKLYKLNIDLLGNACCDCAYAGEKDGYFFCNCGDSKNYEKEIHGRNYCDDFEAN